MRRWLAALAAAAAFLVSPASVSADWLLTPFLGTAVAGETTLGDFDQGAGQTKRTLGISFALLSDGLFGIEADVGHSPGFFQGDVPNPVVLASRVTTLSGSVLIATPLSLTRESLRPYAVAGIGLLQARSSDVLGLGIVSINRNLAALNVGGGAIGMITDNAGLRFDVRYIRALGEDEGLFARAGVARLSFWRASAGVTIRLLY